MFCRFSCTGLLLIAGVALADKGDGRNVDVYCSMLEILAALFAIISGVFLILALVMGGGSKTAPGD